MFTNWKRSAVAIVAASVATFFWGFLYWGVNPLPYQSWLQPKDEPAAREALKRHFPENGTYTVPHMEHEQEELARLYEEGPVVFVHMAAVDGRPVMDPTIMIGGFLLNLVCVLMLAFVFRLAARERSLFETVRFGAAVGVFAALLVDFGDVIWWGVGAEWSLHKALYHITFCIVAALVLGLIDRRPTAEAAAISA